MKKYANQFTQSRIAGLNATAQLVDIYTVGYYLEKLMLLWDFSQVYGTPYTVWMRFAHCVASLMCTMEKLPPFTVIKNSRTPVFLRLMRWARSCHKGIVFLLHMFWKPLLCSAASLPSSPSSLNREGILIMPTFASLTTTDAQLETQESYIELHEEHNTSTNAQCK